VSDDQDAWHLPKFMRDFHAQKDLFKTIAEQDWSLRSTDERRRYPAPDWVSAHVYTVDVFLRFMAEHGYTLQKCRRDAEFKDVEKTVSEATGARRENEGQMLRQLFDSKHR
jgi:hypothetical protein